MKKRRAEEGMTLLEIAEASLHQVRLAPLEVLTPYYIGSLPFALAFLYFWADMIQGATAYRHVESSALGVAAAYVWMKCWQAVYCGRMRANLAGGDPGTWSMGRLVRLVAAQTAIHATSFFVVPISLVLLVPFGAVYAFYQNATVFGAESENGVVAVGKRAWTEARRWPRQNHQVLWLFSPLPLMFAAGLMLVMVPISKALTPDWSQTYLNQFVVVYTVVLVLLSPIGVLVAFNVGMTIVMAPQILKWVVGIDTAVTLGGNYFNSTFFAICVGITALLLDPVLKAAYTLRCFHGEAVSTGEDLRIALKRAIATKGSRVGLAIIVTMAFLAGARAHADEPEIPSRPLLHAKQLDRAIASELEKPEYVWRMPKNIPKDAFKDSILSTFLQAVLQSIADALERVGRFLRWARDLFGGNRAVDAAAGPAGWVAMQRSLWAIVFGALLVALLIITARILKQRSVGEVQAIATPAPVAPNIEDANVTADAMPEEGWLDLARDLMERGELRLAMRALFLATLSVLAHREFVRITKSKSNREYVRELERRGHAAPEVPPLFLDSVRAFERVWYGNHELDRSGFGDFNTKQERIRALAKQQ